MLFIASERIWPWPSTKKSAFPKTLFLFMMMLMDLWNRLIALLFVSKVPFSLRLITLITAFKLYHFLYKWQGKRFIFSRQDHLPYKWYNVWNAEHLSRDREQLLMSLPHSLQFVQITVIVCIAIICHLHLLFFLLVLSQLTGLY